eukprot:210447-Chlamydomonas_euryale.AAC.3
MHACSLLPPCARLRRAQIAARQELSNMKADPNKSLQYSRAVSDRFGMAGFAAPPTAPVVPRSPRDELLRGPAGPAGAAAAAAASGRPESEADRKMRELQVWRLWTGGQGSMAACELVTIGPGLGY